MKSLDFQRLVSDIAIQGTHWRDQAQKCADYYDGYQLSQTRQDQLKRCEQLDVIGNLILPTVNSVLGHEEQRRVDWMVVADDEDSEEVAEGLNQKLNETMRLCLANRYCSDAYKSQMIKGLGWLFVDKNPDLFGTPYLIEEIPLSEIYWDIRSRDPGLKDCRWVARRKYLDFDEALQFFPDQKELIETLKTGWMGSFTIGDESAGLTQRYNEWESNQANLDMILESEGGKRKRIAVYEVYYREFQRIKVLRFSNGVVMEYQPDKSEHLMALVTGQAQGMESLGFKMRRKWFIGPHEIADEPSPHPHNYFPFVPFFGYREDKTNAPYGIVSNMLDPQDAYNEAGFEIHRILDHIRVFVEESATNMRDSDLVRELRRRDGVIRTKDGKSGAIRVEKDWAELQVLDGLQAKYAQQIRDYSGVYNSYSGQSADQVSGVAIQSLAQLGATTLSEINANYEFGRKRLAELVLANLVSEIGQNETVVMIRERDVSAVKKVVVLNKVDQGGVTNRVMMARYQVDFSDVSSTPGYRAQTHQNVMQMFQVSTADPVLMRFLLELAIETSELPNRREILEKWRKTIGSTDAQDPEAQAQAQAQQMEAQAKAMQLEEMKVQTELAERQSQSRLNEARAAQALADAEATKVRLELEEARLKRDMIKQAKQSIYKAKLAAL